MNDCNNDNTDKRIAGMHALAVAFRCVLACALVLAFCMPPAAFLGQEFTASADETSAHQATKITVAAYPLKNDGETWDTLNSKGKSTATKKISKRGGMLRLSVSVVWDDGQTIREYDEENWASRPGFSQGFTYECSDTEKLAVDSRGIMTALADGECTIKVTPNDEANAQLTASIKIEIHNQSGGLQVTKIAVVNEKNKAYGDDPIKFSKLQQSTKVYARVTYENTDAADLKEKIDDQLKSDLLEVDTQKQAEVEKRATAAEQAARKETTEEWEKKKKDKEDAGEEWTDADEKDMEDAISAAVKVARTQARKEVDSEFAPKISAARKKADDEKEQIREKIVYSNAPGADADESPNEFEKEHYYKTVAEAFSTLVWQVGDTEYLTVVNHDGVATLKAAANAMTRLYVVISGGDTSKNVGFGAGRVYGSVSVNVNDTQRARADGQVPADKLTIKVIYEKMPDKVAKEVTYSIKEFEALGAITRTYTLTQKGGNYVTDRAYGVPLATILGKLKLDADDIAYFTLAANDNANPGKLSSKFLLKQARYYLPNYDLGGSWQEKEQVPTMIALKDSWNSNTTVTGEFNEGTRFRLVFGSATSADQCTDKSIKFINTITIVMDGAPPSTDGDGDSTDGNDKGKSDESDNDDSSRGTGVGGGSGSGSGSGDGSGSSSSSSGSSTGGAQADSGGGDASSGSSTPWSIYEMMNNSKSDVPVELEDNPLRRWALPLVLLLALIAAASRYVVFRRRTKEDGAQSKGPQQGRAFA